jgi:hypothetical protein
MTRYLVLAAAAFELADHFGLLARPAAASIIRALHRSNRWIMTASSLGPSVIPVTLKRRRGAIDSSAEPRKETRGRTAGGFR